MRVLMSYIRPHLWYFLLAYVVVIISSGAIMAFGKELSVIVDSGLMYGAQKYYTLAVVLLVVSIISVSAFFRLWLSTMGADRVVCSIRKLLYDKIIHISPAALEDASVALFVSRLITDTTILRTILCGSLLMIFRNVTIMIGSIVMLVHTNPGLAAHSAIVLPVLLPIVAFLGRNVRGASLAFRRSMDKLTHFGEETCRGIYTIQSLVAENIASTQFCNLLDEVSAASSKHVLQRATVVSLAVSTITASVAIVLWVGVQAVVDDSITAGTLLTFVFYSVLLVGSMGGIGDNAQELRKALEIARDITDLLNMDSYTSGIDKSNVDICEVKESIELNNVWFSHRNKPEVQIFKGISFSVKRGEKVAIVGPSGVGKSTIIDLLLRFYDINDGSILVDGVDTRKVSLRSLRSLFCLVPQDSFIFSGTILDNITYGIEKYTDEELQVAIESASLGGFIRDLPEGLNTLVGENGACISEGQKQRIVIARAILRKPQVLILDESTSALDSDNERKVLTSLHELMRDKITIMVTHRLSTVVDADKIVVINNGLVKEVGTHSELVGREDGLYAKLFRLQRDTV
ncbi:ABC transporter ATP-binding protein [Anaplasma bovis]|uniref:ABC transporter ATP-binding protein n=1 Tax=Anaplasma bovis TaxID=186733 RepID=UPI002FF0F505